MKNIACDYLIVGAGLFGSVLAERIADNLGAKVVIIDKRSHIGGNCYSECDLETGIEFHKYGPHIFHTSSKKVWEYINRFGKFNNCRHRGLTTYQNKAYRIPINLETINSFYNLNLKPREAKELLSKEIKKANIKNPKNLEEKAVSLIGWPLYEALIKGYTSKQWGVNPKDLPSEIISRLPVRYNYQDDYQGTSVMNYADADIKYTRICEPKHFHPEKKHIKGKTIIFYETPEENDEEPYYPINVEDLDAKIKLYLQNQELVEEIGKRGQQKILTEYNVERMVKMMLEIIATGRSNLFPWIEVYS